MDLAEPVRHLAMLNLANEKREHFGCMFLDNQHRLIKDEILFSGTIDSSRVHPRIVVQRALELNASAVIFYHNHPAGDPTPSIADQRITDKLKSCCALLDIRALDHIVVGGAETISFAEKGLI